MLIHVMDGVKPCFPLKGIEKILNVAIQTKKPGPTTDGRALSVRANHSRGANGFRQGHGTLVGAPQILLDFLEVPGFFSLGAVLRKVPPGVHA